MLEPSGGGRGRPARAAGPSAAGEDRCGGWWSRTLPSRWWSARAGRAWPSASFWAAGRSLAATAQYRWR